MIENHENISWVGKEGTQKTIIENHESTSWVGRGERTQSILQNHEKPNIFYY